MAKREKQEQHESQSDDFLLVGIGASAGGMKPLLTFFDNLPSKCNMSFVVIQHFDPKHRSLMDRILSQHTSLEVRNVQDGETIEPARVYVKPTNKDVRLEGERLVLSAPPTKAPFHLPIDTFLHSLAEHRGELSACVVLSGTGRDGTLGLKSIKDAGGLVIVQEQAQAEYKGMPGSAIGTGLVDLILRTEKIPEALLRYARHPYLTKMEADESPDEQTERDIRSVLAAVHAHTGHDFSRYKRKTIRRRIDRRLVLHQIQSLAEYNNFLRESPAEVQALFQDLTVTVTGFFRDPEAFEALDRALRERVIRRKNDGDDLRAWVVGCSSGEEAYSTAMLITEAVEDAKKHLNLKLFATEVNPQSLNTARNGTYPDTIALDVGEERLERFFTKKDCSYRVSDRIREMVVFALHDVTRDPPFSQLDLISCRNLLIYLDQTLQHKVLPLLHYGLLPGGLLFLGTAEGVGDFTDLFSPVDGRQRVFSAVNSGRERLYDLEPFTADRRTWEERGEESGGPQRYRREEPVPPARRILEKQVLEKYAPPAVVVDSGFQVIYLHGDADRYLRPPQGEPDWSILKMARKELHYRLRKALHQAQSQGQAVTEENLEIRYGNQLLEVDMKVIPFRDQGNEYLLITFTQEKEELLPAPGGSGEQDESDSRMRSLKQELYTIRQDLQATIEELETANEELKSANEELQANNEELQSTNEELETSREELQSTNEELETVNSELKEKNRQLIQASDDIENFFYSSSIGAVFLDQKLTVKRFTPAVRGIFKLIDTDVGRPLQDITSSIEERDVLSDAREVLETLDHKQLKVRTSEGRNYEAEIRPYRTADNLIDGVVLTFNDVTRFKHLELEARDAQRYAESITATIREPLIVLDGDLKVRSANPAFFFTFNTTPSETEGRKLFDLGNGQWDVPALRTLLESIITEDNEFENYRVECEFPHIGKRVILLNARRIPGTDTRPDLILLAFEDVTGRSGREKSR
jgi:two-component system CheB/CheR fusion protein